MKNSEEKTLRDLYVTMTCVLAFYMVLITVFVYYYIIE